MSHEFYSEYDDAGPLAFARDIMSPEGFKALLDYGAGRWTYVNIKRDARQFMHIMSEADAQAFVDAYAGCRIGVPKGHTNGRLLVTILFMLGYTTVEICSALKITQAHVFRGMREFERDYPEVKTFSASRKLKKADTKWNVSKGRRWQSIYRKQNYEAFMAELRAHPEICDRIDEELKRIDGLRDALPDDPCADPGMQPWRNDKDFPDYTPPEMPN